MSTLRPKLSGAFINNRPNLTQVDKFIKKTTRKQISLEAPPISRDKTGDFFCISLILCFICYFIFFGKKSDNNKQSEKQDTKNKLEQIKTLNYNFFKNNNAG